MPKSVPEDVSSTSDQVIGKDWRSEEYTEQDAIEK